MGCRHLGRPPTRLYDPAPLCARLDHLSGEQAAKLLEIDPGRYRRYRLGRRWLMYNTADRLALRIGCTPVQIWPDFGEPCCEETRR